MHTHTRAQTQTPTHRKQARTHARKFMLQTVSISITESNDIVGESIPVIASKDSVKESTGLPECLVGHGDDILLLCHGQTLKVCQRGVLLALMVTVLKVQTGTK